MEHLLLLHGAIGAKDQLEPLKEALQGQFIVHSMNFSGHGGLAFTGQPFSIPLFANDVLLYLEKENIASANIFGYSMGGYVAMYLGLHHSKKTKKIITLATKFEWDEPIAAKETKMLDAAAITQKIPAFAEQLKQRHAPNEWTEVLEKTKALLIGLGRNNSLKLEDYRFITASCLLMLGDRDKMISEQETVAVSKQLPNARFELLPETPHPIEQVNISLLADSIRKFLL